MLREFFGDGTPRAGEQLVNTTVAGTQEDPTVQARSVGRYVVAWDGNVAGPAASGAAQRPGGRWRRHRDRHATVR